MTTEPAAEGVIKYRLEFTPGAPLGAAITASLRVWHRRLRSVGLIGRDASRYGGLAYGNLSHRLPDAGFIVSASQTADVADPTPAQFTQVHAWDCRDNRLRATGPAPPSSESLTHAALYDADPDIAWIYHVHSPLLWRQRHALRLPTSDPAIAYGTPAMAQALAALRRTHPDHALYAMGGHADGLISVGRDADATGMALLGMLERVADPGAGDEPLHRGGTPMDRA